MRAARCNAASAEGSGQRSVAVLTATMWQCVWMDFKCINCQLQELRHLSLPTAVMLRSALVYIAYWTQTLCELHQIHVSKMTSLPTGELQLREMSLHDVQGKQSCCVDNPGGRVVGPACDRTKGAMLTVRSDWTPSIVSQSANPTRQTLSLYTPNPYNAMPGRRVEGRRVAVGSITRKLNKTEV